METGKIGDPKNRGKMSRCPPETAISLKNNSDGKICLDSLLTFAFLCDIIKNEKLRSEIDREYLKGGI